MPLGDTANFSSQTNYLILSFYFFYGLHKIDHKFETYHNYNYFLLFYHIINNI